METKTIRATVSDDTLSKVTRFFNATVTDIINELLQNARRAGASRIDFTIDDELCVFGKQAITITDNGKGITNPELLLSFGNSGWSNSVQQKEDPAGMGVFSLSNRKAFIRSLDWSMLLVPDDFSEKKGALIHSCDYEEKTSISFPLIESEYEDSDKSRKLIQDSVRYFPLKAYLSGKPLESQDFLSRAVYTENWKGLRLGVFKDLNILNPRPLINFHGVTILASSGIVLAGRSLKLLGYRIFVDVVNCPELKLVLPERKEVVENQFLSDLKTESKKVVYRYIKTLDPHSLPFSYWLEAKQLGIKLLEATQELEPFYPREADSFFHDEITPEPKIQVPKDAIVLDILETKDYRHSATHPAVENCLYQAILKKGSPLKSLKFFRPNPYLKGYSWYDRLARVTSFEFKPHPEKVVAGFNDCIAKTITLNLDIKQKGKASTLITAKAPAWLEGAENNRGDLSQVTIVLAKEHGFTVDSLSNFLFESLYYFREYEDSEETQSQNFRSEADSKVMALLFSKKQAEVETIKRATERHIKWHIPIYTVATITVSSKQTTVDISHTETTI